MERTADPGDVDSYVAEVRHILEAGYAVQDQRLDGRRVFVAHRKDFRLRWLATPLYTP